KKKVPLGGPVPPTLPTSPPHLPPPSLLHHSSLKRREKPSFNIVRAEHFPSALNSPLKNHVHACNTSSGCQRVSHSAASSQASRKRATVTKVRNKAEQAAILKIMVELQTVPRSSVGASAPIELLDWFDLDQELILVLETPIPCKDLLGYVWDNGASLEEEEAKIILKQLQNSHVFHRDIKPENILLETGSDVPRLRLIDFVVSCCYPHYRYRAGPTTVGQVGAVLFDMLHRNNRFDTTRLLIKQLPFSSSLSQQCKDFLHMCFTEEPAQRPTLEDQARVQQNIRGLQVRRSLSSSKGPSAGSI
uniref:non-specific serine/threonine protein kinase n=1 Tax=Stegastes partitus TaxID=144197 RepID=A0A3B5BFT5_9TELE